MLLLQYIVVSFLVRVEGELGIELLAQTKVAEKRETNNKKANMMLVSLFLFPTEKSRRKKTWSARIKNRKLRQRLTRRSLLDRKRHDRQGDMHLYRYT
jgi:hypothetical protein